MFLSLVKVYRHSFSPSCSSPPNSNSASIVPSQSLVSMSMSTFVLSLDSSVVASVPRVFSMVWASSSGMRRACWQAPVKKIMDTTKATLCTARAKSRPQVCVDGFSSSQEELERARFTPPICKYLLMFSLTSVCTFGYS